MGALDCNSMQTNPLYFLGEVFTTPMTLQAVLIQTSEFSPLNI